MSLTFNENENATQIMKNEDNIGLHFVRNN